VTQYIKWYDHLKGF